MLNDDQKNLIQAVRTTLQWLVSLNSGEMIITKECNHDYIEFGSDQFAPHEMRKIERAVNRTLESLALDQRIKMCDCCSNRIVVVK